MESRHCRVVYALAAVIACVPCSALAGKSGESAADSAPLPNLVAELYQSTCGECHGNAMQGGRGPSLRVPTPQSDADEKLVQIIQQGRPTRGMPAWGSVLSEGEIRSLVIYIREQRAGPRDKTLDHDSVPTGAVRSELENFRVETLVDQGLDEPWSMTFLPNGHILVTEKATEKIRLVTDGRLASAPIRDTPKDPEGAGIYYEVAAHSRNETNGWIYLSRSYSCKRCDGGGGVALVRGRIRAGAWVDSEKLLETGGGFSLTGRIAFDDAGHVYLTTGSTHLVPDRTRLTMDAQDLSNGSGKIFRIYDDGRVPNDNPFVRKVGALAAIWSYGHRNPQGLAFNSYTEELWSTEHGPRGGDELNWIRGGLNYGWPIISYGMDYVGRALVLRTHQEGMEQPVVDWTPDIAVSNLTFYEGAAFPRWRHQLFVGSLAERTLFRLELVNHQVVHQEAILKGIGRIRDVKNGPDGAIYLLLEHKGSSGLSDSIQGRIVRLVPENQSFAPHNAGRTAPEDP